MSGSAGGGASTGPAASAIRPLGASLAARLVAAPQVPDSALAASELVSNSLDAGARRVVVTLLALGPDDVAFSVEDDGAGIPPDSFAHLGVAGCTSKLRSAEQLARGPATLGFKGQALAALAQLGSLEVVSRAAGSFETYTKSLRLGAALRCGPAAAPRARRGTTVAVRDFAAGQPVRRRAVLQDAARGAVAEAVARRLVALLLPRPEVELLLVDATAVGGADAPLLHLRAGRRVADVYPTLLWEVPPGALRLVSAASASARVEGCAAAPDAACSSTDQRHTFVNRRPTRCAQLDALLGAWFAHSSALRVAGEGATLLGRNARRARPAYVLEITCDAADADMTSEPDKSGCVFRRWQEVAAVVMDALAPLWGPPPAAARNGAALGGVAARGRGAGSGGGRGSRGAHFNPLSSLFLGPDDGAGAGAGDCESGAAAAPVAGLGYASGGGGARRAAAGVRRMTVSGALSVLWRRQMQDQREQRGSAAAETTGDAVQPSAQRARGGREGLGKAGHGSAGPPGAPSKPEPTSGPDATARPPKRVRFSAAGSVGAEAASALAVAAKPAAAAPGQGAPPSWHAKGKQAAAPDAAGNGSRGGGGGGAAVGEGGETGMLSLEDVARDAAARGRAGAGGALVPEEVTRGDLEVARVIDQVDRKLVLVACGGLLAAVDQHAADERVQLEALQDRLAAERAARLRGPPPAAGLQGAGAPLLQQQALRPPQPLDLSASERAALVAHSAAAESWGWRVAPAAPARPGPHAAAAAVGAEPAGAGLALASAPLLCGVMLGGLDLKLYLHQLAECGGAAGGAPPPGALRVLRSKACRGAAMFGDELPRARCEALLGALRGARLPFCCAHGRPTTAPLVDLRALARGRGPPASARGAGGGGGRPASGGAGPSGDRKSGAHTGGGDVGRLTVERLRRLVG